MLPVKNATVTNIYRAPPPPGITYRKGYHPGIDLVSDNRNAFGWPGTILLARSALGRGYDPFGWGNYTIIRTLDKKYDLIYGHLSEVIVREGVQVDNNTKVGIVGASGQTNGGIHLHFEVRRAPWTNYDEVDPASFLGIYNCKGPVQFMTVFKNLIICDEGIDEHTSAFLSDKLDIPIITTNFLVDVKPEQVDRLAENIYQIGTSKKYSNKAVIIAVGDRYDTCRKVLDICQGK